VGREERDHVAVIECKAGGAEALRIGAEIEATPDEAGLEVGQAIPAIAIRLEKRVEIGEEEDGRARHAAERLLETEIGRLLTEVTPLQELEGMRGGAIGVGAGLDSLHRVNGQIEIHQSRGHVRPPATGGVPERRGKLLDADGRAGELARGAASQDRVCQRAPRPRPRRR